MGILIGMDEAGYGPNLGPLVVAATAWYVPDQAAVPDTARKANGRRVATGNIRTPRLKRSSATGDSATGAVALATKKRSTSQASRRSDEIDLYRILRGIVAKSANDRRVPIADSKVLYNPAAGLRQLERGLHAVLLAIPQQLTCWSAIVDYCGADTDNYHLRVCWPDGFDCRLPVHACPDELARLGTRFARACDTAGVRPITIRARLVFPEQFNDMVEHFGNKATALSHITTSLLREVMDLVSPAAPTQSPAPSPQPPIHIVCDKHGGRNFYTAFLQHHFSEYWIAPIYESHAESRYEWGPDDARVRATFRMNGETFLPTALASMTAKYLRELAMRAFNEFWQSHVSDLRPTAGYYGDSRRFKRDIESKQRELKIDNHLIWRSR